MPSRPLETGQMWECGSQCPQSRPPPPPPLPTRGTVNATPTPLTITSTQTLASTTSVAAYRWDSHTHRDQASFGFSGRSGRRLKGFSQSGTNLFSWYENKQTFFLRRKKDFTDGSRSRVTCALYLSCWSFYPFLSASLSIYLQCLFMYCCYIVVSLSVCLSFAYLTASSSSKAVNQKLQIKLGLSVLKKVWCVKNLTEV